MTSSALSLCVYGIAEAAERDAASRAGKLTAQAEIKRSTLLMACGRRKESNL